ncbi:hypothetical protein ANTPLA_LOCUS3322 [Anthophora plagiata]
MQYWISCCTKHAQITFTCDKYRLQQPLFENQIPLEFIYNSFLFTISRNMQAIARGKRAEKVEVRRQFEVFEHSAEMLQMFVHTEKYARIEATFIGTFVKMKERVKRRRPPSSYRRI